METLGEPLRFLAAPKVHYKPGMVETLDHSKKRPRVVPCKPGDHPIGVVAKTRPATPGVRFGEKWMVKVWASRMVFRTGAFEPGTYLLGDFLYPAHGSLGLQHKDGEYPVARVIEEPDKTSGCLGFLWL